MRFRGVDPQRSGPNLCIRCTSPVLPACPAGPQNGGVTTAACSTRSRLLCRGLRHRQVAEGQLEHAIERGGPGPSPLAGTTISQLCARAPHAVFDGSLRAIADGHQLDSVHMSGYRYLVFKDTQPLAAAEVAVNDNRDVTHVSVINFGSFVASTVTGIQLSEVLPAVTSGT